MFLTEDDAKQSSAEYNVDKDTPSDQLPLRDQRALVFHLLYAMDAFDYQTSLESIADNLSRGFNCSIKFTDKVFIQASHIITQRELLDQEILPLLDNWRFERLGVCTKLILRLALWELKNTSTEPTIIINEAIELAKCFAEQDAYKFINGVLDEWFKRKNSSEEIIAH